MHYIHFLRAKNRSSDNVSIGPFAYASSLYGISFLPFFRKAAIDETDATMVNSTVIIKKEKRKRVRSPVQSYPYLVKYGSMAEVETIK